MKKFIAGLIGVFVLATAPSIAAGQDTPNEEEKPAQPAKPAADEGADTDSGASDEESDDDAAQTDGEDEEGDGDAAKEPKQPVDAAREGVDGAEDAAENSVKPKPKPEPKKVEPPSEPALPDADADNPFGDSPIADLADEEFVPLEDIDEGGLEQIIPAKVYPRVDWDGTFRVRTGAMINWDLDTEGTSAILPPAESFTPQGNPINEDRDTHWDANLRLKLNPTLLITERLRVHTELDFLDNANFGSLPSSRLGLDPVTPDLTRRVGQSGQFSPRESAFFDNAIQINELYGEVSTLLGKVSAGRMDDDFGLGIFANGGDCLDCNYGDHLDRFMFETKVWVLRPFAALDFPDEGVFSRVAERDGGQPYDIAQIDDVDQYTIGVTREPKTREERELQGKRLLDDQLPVFNGGLQYRYRKQDGRFADIFGTYDPNGSEAIIYRGERIHLVDLWVQFLYQPDFDTKVRIELEGITALGRVDNVTNDPVGLPQDTGNQRINCFDKDQFQSNEAECTTTDSGVDARRAVEQFGLALESEFQLDSPVSFGVNGGVASGGDTANWGTADADLRFYRFNPDYHVDLILFRNVIGTVTNAYYFNPWAMVKFLDSSSRHIEVQLDAIGSRAFDINGTPSGTSPWLGLEFDAAVRYVNLDLFTAALEAGILFPFEGLAAQPGRPRYTTFGGATPDFNSETSARIAWTLQAKFFWNF